MLHPGSVVIVALFLLVVACDEIRPVPSNTPKPKEIYGFPPGTELAAMRACENLSGLEYYGQGNSRYFTTFEKNNTRMVNVTVKCRSGAVIDMAVPVPKD